MVTEAQVLKAYDNDTATIVGELEPCREMKWNGWVVVKMEDEHWAICVDKDKSSNWAEKIKDGELHMYMK